jgi:hypothetical protein
MSIQHSYWVSELSARRRLMMSLASSALSNCPRATAAFFDKIKSNVVLCISSTMSLARCSVFHGIMSTMDRLNAEDPIFVAYGNKGKSSPILNTAGLWMLVRMHIWIHSVVHRTGAPLSYSRIYHAALLLGSSDRKSSQCQRVL